MLELPNEDIFIDGNWEHCPYSGPRSVATYANHSACPNAKFEHWPLQLTSDGDEALELRHRMWLVATEAIPAGCEIRVDYEAGQSTYWQGAQPLETNWRSERVPPPLPPSPAPPVLDHLARLLRGCPILPLESLCDDHPPLAWEGADGGDERLAWLLPHLMPGITECNAAASKSLPWALVATHVPQRSSLECARRGLSAAADLERKRHRLQKRKDPIELPRSVASLSGTASSASSQVHGRVVKSCSSSSLAPSRNLSASGSSDPLPAVAAVPFMGAPMVASVPSDRGGPIGGGYKDALKREQYLALTTKLLPTPAFEEPPPNLLEVESTLEPAISRPSSATVGGWQGDYLACARAVFAGHLQLSLTGLTDCIVPPRAVTLINQHGLPNVSMQRLQLLIRAVADSACSVGAENLGVLQSLHRLAMRAHGTYGKPCQLIHVRWQPPMPWRVPDDGAPVSARLDIWLAEALFTMRSDYDIWLMMSKLQPCKPILPRPLPPPRQVLPSGTPLAYRFSLAGLMRSMESTGYAEAEQPEALKLSLFPFQRQSLQWMLDREQQPGGLNMCFWQEHPLLPGSGRSSFFYNPTCGELMSPDTMVDGRPPISTGGFLCEEMGLGKTIELIGLVLSNPFDEAVASSRSKAFSNGSSSNSATISLSRATLVVVPLSLLAQWRDEVDKCVEKGHLRVGVWYPFDSERSNQEQLDPQDLSTLDIVLTTYDAVIAETRQLRGDAHHGSKVLLSMCWWRVVLDESQRVSKSANLTTKTCCALPRVHSWLLSGTPVGNVVEDLLGQLLFLRVEPFCRMGQGVDNFWEREVTSRFRAHDEDALEIVDELLGMVMMRHSKAQTLTGADGVSRPIVTLPEIRTQDVVVHLGDASESAVYLALEAYCQEEVNEHALRSPVTALRGLSFCSEPPHALLAASFFCPAMLDSEPCVSVCAPARCSRLWRAATRRHTTWIS